MNEDTMAKYIRSAFSASYLIAESDGEISGQEAEAFMQALKQLRDVDMDPDEVWESFRDALEHDEEDHLSWVSVAADLPEELRREILQVALAVASADGEVSLSEILCLPDIAAALDVELGDEDDEDGNSEEDEAVHFPRNKHREKQTSVSDRETVFIGVCTHDLRLAENETDEVVPDPVRVARIEWLGSRNDPGHPRYQAACRLLSDYYNCVFNEAVDTFSISMEFTLDLENGSIEQDDSTEKFTSADEDAGVEDALGGAPELKSLKVVSIDFRESPSFEAVSDDDHLLCFPEVGLVAVFEGRLGRDFGNKASLAAWVEQNQETVASRFRFEPREAPEDQETDDDGFYSSFSWSGGDATVRISGSSTIDSFIVELTQSVFEKRKEEEGASEVVSEKVLAGLRKFSDALEAQPEASREDDEDSSDGDDGEASKKFAASLREAEAALKAEGNPAPSAAEISQRAISDMLSGMAGNLEAALVQRRGFAAWKAGDYQLARKLYLEAAEAGDVDAMYNIGQMHMAGEGVRVDWAEAVAWWVRAAEQGHLQAQRNAWKALASGRAGEPDEVKAIELAIMAARQGDEESSRFVTEKTMTSLQVSALIAGSLMAGADGEVTDGELTVFGDAWKQAIGVDYSLDDLRSAFAEYSGDTEALASVLPRLRATLPLELRQRILQVSILVALSDRHFSPEEMAMVESLAEALDVDLSDIGNGLGLRRAADDEETEAESAEEEDFDPQTNPVLVAALNGDAGKVRDLLGEGYSATDIHASGTDAVIIAVREGHLEIVRILLEAGADPNRINSQSGTTPLRMAVQEKRIEIAQYLLSKGADPDLRDPASGIGALAILVLAARTYDHKAALRLLDLLLAQGAGLHSFTIEDHEFSMLSFAAIQPGLPAGFIARLAERAKKEDVDLALWYACIEDQAENVRDLIAAGADVNMAVPELEHDPSAAGDCPLNAAATRGHGECARLLIGAGADPNRNVPPEGGQFPLLMAAENGHAEIVGMLIDAGADVSRINPDNGTHALGGAVLRGHPGIVNLLLKAGADPNIESGGYGGPAITFAAHGGHLEIVRSLIKHGAETDAAGAEFGNTALILASNQGHTEITDLLLQNGADPRKINPVNGSDALLAAVMGGNAGCVSLLLEAGADPNRSYDGNTGMIPLLVLAGDKGKAEIVRLLAQHGADVRVTDGEGLTALQRAGIHRYKEVEAVLIEFGADPSTRLVKFTDTEAGREMQNEILSRMAGNLRETARKIGDTENSPSAEESAPEEPRRGFFTRLFGWGRRP